MRTVKLARPSVRMLDGAAVLALLSLVLLFNPGLAFGGLIPGGYDTLVYFYPYRAYFAQAVAEGRLPLWNPHLFLGVPFLANPQAAVLYPPTLLFALLDVPSGYVANLLGHLMLAAVGMYAFARGSLALGPPGSLLGACAFAFSGFLGGQAGHINQVSVAAWLPVVALAADLMLRRRSPWAAAGLVGGLAMQLLAGHPQEVYMTLVVLGVVVLWRCGLDGPRALARGLGLLGPVTALAFGIAAVQLVPTAELARLSIRGGGLDYAEASDISLPWGLLVPALLPGYWTHLHTTELFGHLGVMVFALAWLGLTFGPRRPAVLGGVLVALGLALAVGDATPLYRTLFDWAPGFASFRVPARWLFVYTFGASMLVAAGVDRLVSGGRGERQDVVSLVARSVVGLGVLLGLAALVQYGEPQQPGLLPIWGGLAAAAGSLALIAALLPRLRVAALALLFVGGLVELWVAAADLEHRHPIPSFAYAEPRESAQFLRSRDGLDGRFRMLSIAGSEYEVKETPAYREWFGELHPRAFENLLVAVKLNESMSPNVPLQYRLDGADGYDGGVLPLSAYVRLSSAMVGDRARPDGVLASRLGAIPERRWLDLLGVRYVLAGKIMDLTDNGLYYDRAVVATLNPGERLELRSLPLGEFTRLGVLSSFSGPSRDGQEVARLELADDAADPTMIPLRDRVHTASSDATPEEPAAALEPIEPWNPADGAVDWLAQVEFPRRPVRRLSITNTSADLVVAVRSLNLVDDGRAASFSLTLDDRLERTEFFDMKVYDRRDALPRAHVVGRAELLDDAAAARRLGDRTFDPRQVVVLEPWAGAILGEGSSVGAGTIGGVAELELSRPEQVRIRARADAPAYVVLADSWYPGWRATVDGQEAPIRRANLLFRAVEVPAGEHLVDFSYEPLSFRIGAAVSGLSLVGGVFWLALRARRRG